MMPRREGKITQVREEISRPAIECVHVGSTIGIIGDLLLVLLVSVAAAATTLSNLDVPIVARALIGLPAGLFIPGYSAICVLFPRRSSLDGLARIALSFTLSLAIIPLAALATRSSSGPFTGTSVVGTLTAMTLIFIMVATVRRLKTPPIDRSVPSLPAISMRSPRTWSRPARTASVIAMICAVLVFGSALTLVGSYVEKDPTTEFALLNSAGEPEFYERYTRPGESATVTLKVTNREGKQQQYAIRVVVQDQVIGETPVFIVEDGNSWNEQVEFTPPVSDELLPVVFELYRDPSAEDEIPYRWLRLMRTST